MAPSKHPVTAGWIAGSMEIMVTFPLEYVKTQLQVRTVVAQRVDLHMLSTACSAA